MNWIGLKIWSNFEEFSIEFVAEFIVGFGQFVVEFRLIFGWILMSFHLILIGFLGQFPTWSNFEEFSIDIWLNFDVISIDFDWIFGSISDLIQFWRIFDWYLVEFWCHFNWFWLNFWVNLGDRFCSVSFALNFRCCESDEFPMHFGFQWKRRKERRFPALPFEFCGRPASEISVVLRSIYSNPCYIHGHVCYTRMRQLKQISFVGWISFFGAEITAIF